MLADAPSIMAGANINPPDRAHNLGLSRAAESNQLYLQEIEVHHPYDLDFVERDPMRRDFLAQRQDRPTSRGMGQT